MKSQPDYFNEDGELCPALVRKNIVLAETGGELTVPLAILNLNCEFRKKWNEIQNKWHKPKINCFFCGKEIKRGKYCYNKKCREKVKEKMREYYQKPEVKEKMREYYQKYYQKPEVKEKQREKMREYYQKNKEIINKKGKDRYLKTKLQEVKVNIVK
jgi:hypothetical protein